jgi:trehalose 6-phosphate synthase/phosphatase
MNDPDPTGRTEGRRLVMVSNRLPVVLSQARGGDWRMERGSGGLVTALEPALRRSEGLWIGWPGVDESELAEVEPVLERESEQLGYRVSGIGLTEQEQEDFYRGFSNQVIWPLFHDFQTQCNFDPDFWAAYRSVNRKFAAGVEREAGPKDFVWVHDYHLMGLGEELRAGGIRRDSGFFLHIPFPPLDLFLKLPWRFEILRSLLHFDLIGFQTMRDTENFLHAIRSLLPGVRLVTEGRITSGRIGTRTVRIGAFPISIDFDEFASTAAEPQVEARSRELLEPYRDRIMLLGVDRLDYSKGIPHKLQGFRLALREYPELQERVTLVQLVVPSREDIPQYDEMKREIERLVGEISGEFTRPGWLPIHYQYGRWDREELIAHYRAARVALVTPLKDGMNLVAKEYCASNLDEEGVLVLSEHAGATAQLAEGALLVNPYDVEDVARTIHRACEMEEDERRRRMKKLRARIREEDIHWWVRTFLSAASGEKLEEEGEQKRYLPHAPDGFFEGILRPRQSRVRSKRSPRIRA